MVTISIKIQKNIFAEIALRVPEGERSSFIRDAIIMKLQDTPQPNKILSIEKKIKKIEGDISKIKISLTDLEVLTYDRGKVNPHTFCIDKTDHSIINHLIHYKGATTSEIAQTLNVNRWFVLNRLKKIARQSQKELGKPIVEYCGRNKAGKKKAWWLNEELANDQ